MKGFKKPSWIDAPDNAKSLAQCDYNDPQYHIKGKWYWMMGEGPESGNSPGYFINYEKRRSNKRWSWSRTSK